ncbi:unnamed protein product [Orchesella dallaii]|uniref:Gustatory receptor n=1 Tax=Orchesella dallaii TaxID=48710 RepID=A0ABP1S0S3_9HEXA
MITQLQEASFKLHNFFLWYFPRFPIAWNSNYTKLVISESKWTWGLWLICLFDTFLVAAANTYVLVTHFLIEKRKQLGLTHIVVFSVGTCAVLTVFTLLVLIVIKRKIEAVKSFNELLTLHQKMTLEFRPTKPGKANKTSNEKVQPDTFGIVMCAVSFALTSVPPLVILFVVFGRFDCVTFIAHDILPPVEYWGFDILFALFAIKLVFVGTSIIEILRCLNTFILLAGLELMSMQEIVYFLRNKMADTHQFIQHYLPLFTCYKYMAELLAELCWILLSVTFWGIVATVWIVINGYGKFEPFFYAAITGGCIMAICIAMFVGRIIMSTLMTLDQMIDKRVKAAKGRYIRTKTVRSKTIFKRAFALTPIVVWFGVLIPVKVDFLKSYAENMIDKTIDFVVMFDM